MIKKKITNLVWNLNYTTLYVHAKMNLLWNLTFFNLQTFSLNKLYLLILNWNVLLCFILVVLFVLWNQTKTFLCFSLLFSFCSFINVTYLVFSKHFDYPYTFFCCKYNGEHSLTFWLFVFLFSSRSSILEIVGVTVTF